MIYIKLFQLFCLQPDLAKTEVMPKSSPNRSSQKGGVGQKHSLSPNNSISQTDPMQLCSPEKDSSRKKTFPSQFPPAPPSHGSSSSQLPEVIQINLSNIHRGESVDLPENVKLRTENGIPERSKPSTNQEESSNTYDVILRPSRSKVSLSGPQEEIKPLWRKREVVRQERTVYYTTLDEQGDMQVSCIY